MQFVTIAPCTVCDSESGEEITVPAMSGNTARLNRVGYTVVLCADCGTEQSRTITKGN